MIFFKSYQTRTAGIANIPVLGLGTWQLLKEDCVNTVRAALNMGYEHIDTAQAYQNEAQVGAGIKQSGVSRDRFFLTTKIFPDDWRFEPENMAASVHTSLERLGVDYVDLLLLHWPDKRVPLSRTLPALCALQKKGLTRHIGVSNFTIDLLIEAQKHADVPLACNQVELHPFIRQRNLQTFMHNRHLPLVAYSPLARGRVFKNDTLIAIANKHNATPAQVALAWILADKTRIAIPKTSTLAHLRSNLAALNLSLDEDDVAKINALAHADGRIIEYRRYMPEWDD